MLLKNKLLVAAAALMALAGCKEEDKTQQASQVPAVDVVQVAPQDIPLAFEFAARAQGSKETEVRARVGGILLKRNYVEGSRVEEGQLLFEIDPAQYAIELDKAKANLIDAEATLSQAESQWNRIEKLHKEGYASGKDYDSTKAAYDSAKAAAMLAKANLDAAQLNLDYTKVTAPISGITSMETQSEGSLISSTGDASLLTHITQLDPIYVIFSASENEILSLTNMVDRGLIKYPDTKAKEIKAKVKFGDDTVYSEEGEINFINPAVDEKTGTIKLRAVFPNPEGRIRPGQFLRLLMEGLVRINALVVPQEAVMQSPNGTFVYRVNANNVIESVSVQAGLMTKDGGWIIDEGLKPGDKIITGGIMKLRPGMTVNPEVVYDQEAVPEKEEK